ncbi:hypothetical protein VTN31DRAFT_2109 [Thermomyces dupontii]|uniref:uncharacterized protein n=1 Tax=Talaromyces thermophilus TaxID=28565 RepID=UPI003742367A
MSVRYGYKPFGHRHHHRTPHYREHIHRVDEASELQQEHEGDESGSGEKMSEQTNVPERMQALRLPRGMHDEDEEKGNLGQRPRSGPALLEFDSAVPTPIPTPSQYLVKVLAAGVCVGEVRAMARMGNKYRNPPSKDAAVVADGPDLRGPIPGREFCGKIISTPTEDQQTAAGPAFKVGDEVIGLLRCRDDRSDERDGDTDAADVAEGGHGAAAEYTLAVQKELALKPRNLSAAEAATLPLATLMAWQALFVHAGFDSDDGECNRPSDGPLRVLVTNAGGTEVGRQVINLFNVPTFFPALSHHLMGGKGPNESAVWICVTGEPADLDALRQGNCKFDACTTRTDIAEAFRENGWDPVDVAIDCSGPGSSATRRMLHSPVVLKDKGRIIGLNQPHSAYPDKPSERDMRAEAQARGIVTEHVKVQPNGRHLAAISRYAERGDIRPLCNVPVFDLIDGREALVDAEKKRGMPGRVILRVDPAISEI